MFGCLLCLTNKVLPPSYPTDSKLLIRRRVRHDEEISEVDLTIGIQVVNLICRSDRLAEVIGKQIEIVHVNLAVVVEIAQLVSRRFGGSAEIHGRRHNPANSNVANLQR